MKSRSLFAAPILALGLVSLLGGCASFKYARVYGECTNKIGGGGECKVGAEARWEGGGQQQQKFVANLLSAMSIAPDAASYTLDVAGSTIPYPTTGTLIVVLKDSTTGSVQAAQSFAWVRAGTIIRAADPDAVNNWAYANAGTADTISYELTRFNSSYGSGQQVIAGNSKYDGATQTTYSVVFDGGRNCIKDPSPLLCQKD